MRKVLTILLPLLVVLTACGGPTTDNLTGRDAGNAAGAGEIFDSVTVSGGSDDEAPTVEFDAPIDTREAAAKTVAEGDGDEIEAGQQIGVKLVALNAEDGSVLGETYSQGEPQVLPLDDTFKQEFPELFEVLIGSKVGAQVAFSSPAPEAAEGAADTPEQILVLKVLSAEQPPPEPEVLSPEDVQTLDDEGRLPTFTFTEDGAPEVSIPDNEPSDDLVVKVLKEGTGEVITEADTIKANYSGWRWEDGEQFDSSFERGEASEFPLTGVIEGWTKGLSGLKVGSQVLLVIPAPWAYGDPAQEGRPSGTLVFFVEITEKVDPAQ
ncbi:FK506-binding protein [Arthrobacter agilis]|uniref:FKBP-type peptidyl-prolyl cis-trans isomerase n=1 Tax=Arthrobacter agilis TaxID=37921 RepID=UPI000F70853B|nr:FKBP-type peptidyl-prolyl cis-trans isomerase [Arthrobacter agilis]VDR32085.1 FK506-binding protein [Arthrobacter agilis]